MNWKIIEELVVPRHDGQLSSDILIHGRCVVGVVDGATAKEWHASGLKDNGRSLAVCIADVLGEAKPDESLETLVERASTAVARLKRSAGHATTGGACATFAAFHLERREVWRVGDPWIRIGKIVYPPLHKTEDIVAAARALVVRAALANGERVEDLRASDPGRDAILPLLRAAETFRNRLGNLGFAAIDGGSVPNSFLECLPVSDAKEVVLATDGYLDISSDLSGAERHLQNHLKQDPLCVLDFPQTKCCITGANSFDDRAYIRMVSA